MDTRLVVLVRHAKAESGEEGSDHDRRLTSAGERAAASAGEWLAGQVDRLDRVWVSSATRARQTWEAMRPALPTPDEVEVDQGLYQAGPNEVTDWVAGADVPVAVVVGHNPTLEEALAALTGELRGLRTGAAALVEIGEDRHRLVDLWEPPR